MAHSVEDVVRPSRAVTRSRSCSAALRLKVSASTDSGSAPRRSTRSTIASTRVVVLPVPGPASTSSGPPAWSTTRRWSASSVGAAASLRGRRRRYDGLTAYRKPSGADTASAQTGRLRKRRTKAKGPHKYELHGPFS